MAVPVMQVGIMRVLVPHGLMAVHVAVRLRHGPLMLMLVMGIVHMTVVMLEFVVHMVMFVALGKMEPQSDRHEDAGNYQPHRYRIAKHQDREDRTDERRH